MNKKDTQQAIPGLPDKWTKIIAKMPDFKETADAGDVEDLKKVIVDAESNIYVQEQEMAADVKLGQAKELVKECSAVYREAIKFQMAKIKYALWLLSEKGIDLDSLGDREE